MKFGLTLMSYVYDGRREPSVAHSLKSLAKTNTDGLERPVLEITAKPTGFDYQPFVDLLSEKFTVLMKDDPAGMHWTHVLQDAGLALLVRNSDVTHLQFLCDDRIYNSEWLRQLNDLVGRHPDARAWAVYRAAYTYYHQIVGGDGVDVLMSMNDTIGCVTRQEWEEFSQGSWGYSPDIDHAARRPGQRWATSRDYMQNICRHPEIEAVDCAIDFVGE